MRLSESIRLGAMLRPQAFGVTANATGTCALGGALAAIGVAGTYNDALDHWPVASLKVQHPIHDYEHVLYGVVRSLNDEHRWTRAQIADWVATIEAQQAPTPIETPVAVSVRT